MHLGSIFALALTGLLLQPPVAGAEDVVLSAQAHAAAAQIEAAAASRCTRQTGAARQACFEHMRRAAAVARAPAAAQPQAPGADDEQ